jgi:hypothetical protein
MGAVPEMYQLELTAARAQSRRVTKKRGWVIVRVVCITWFKTIGYDVFGRRREPARYRGSEREQSGFGPGSRLGCGGQRGRPRETAAGRASRDAPLVRQILLRSRDSTGLLVAGRAAPSPGRGRSWAPHQSAGEGASMSWRGPNAQRMLHTQAYFRAGRGDEFMRREARCRRGLVCPREGERTAQVRCQVRCQTKVCRFEDSKQSYASQHSGKMATSSHHPGCTRPVHPTPQKPAKGQLVLVLSSTTVRALELVGCYGTSKLHCEP